MNAHQTTTLIIRLLGVVWFLAVLNQLGAMMVYVSGGSVPPTGTGYLLLIIALQVLACGLLWLWPATIAAKLLPSALSAQPRPSSSPQQWQTVGVVCVGLWALAGGVPEAIRWLGLWRVAIHADVPGPSARRSRPD